MTVMRKALTIANPLADRTLDLARLAIVTVSALALICAGRPLPF